MPRPAISQSQQRQTTAIAFATMTALSFRPSPVVLRCANLQIRPSGMQVFAEGRPLDLTQMEFRLLCALAQRRNRVVARADLYELVWRRPMTGRNRSVDVLVLKLRSKLDEASPGWSYVHTHPGIGYRFSPRRHA